MHVLHVVGARPNFMKLAPVHAALAQQTVRQTVVHTGQHYDQTMSDVFFKDLQLPPPDVNLNVGSGSHAQQTADVMQRLEPALIELNPSWVVVYGDVNSTVAAALVCAKRLLPVAHVEAGLRSRDRTMPEEINRIVTDQLCDLLFTPSEDADFNLRSEGVPAERIKFVGNVMVDTLLRLRPAADLRWPEVKKRIGTDRFGLLTLHRPSNVDDPERLRVLLKTISALSSRLPFVFPIHPRTREMLRKADFKLAPTMIVTEPVGYVDFLALQSHAAIVVTDSGGIQEETTVLGVPCLTLRENTERPVTVSLGTNQLVGHDMAALRASFEAVLTGEPKVPRRPPLWDGAAGERIATELIARP